MLVPRLWRHGTAESDAAPAKPEGIPLFITRRQKERLLEMGYDDEAIRVMRPAEAHRILGVGSGDIN